MTDTLDPALLRTFTEVARTQSFTKAAAQLGLGQSTVSQQIRKLEGALGRRVLQRDKVDVVFAGFSSASREAYRPIVDQFNGFAFYNNQYEGGVCDGNMIGTGGLPEQQFSTLIPYMMEKYGKKVYTLAADYNFGQISAEWVRKIVKENGGEMAGEEFIPLGVSQFSQKIGRAHV